MLARSVGVWVALACAFGCASGGSRVVAPLHEGKLLGFNSIALASLTDPKTGQLLLMPGARTADEVEDNGQLIGVIDSGILEQHPQLRGFIAEARAFVGADARDEVGHGTVIALLAVHGNGQTQDAMGVPRSSARLLVAKVTAADRRLDRGTVVKAINWVVAQGATVVNLSLGFEGGAGRNRSICMAIRAHPSVLFLAAAGNEGPERVFYPAACPEDNVLSVGACDSNGYLPWSGQGELCASGTAHLGPPGWVLYEQGLEMARRGALDSAKLVLQKSLELMPTPAERVSPSIQLALIARAERGIQAGEAALLASLVEGRATAVVLAEVGAGMLIEERNEEARSFLQVAVYIQPSMARGWHNLGIALVRLGELSGALAAFERTAQLDSTYPGVTASINEVRAMIRRR